ncbi:hypothetical protein ABFS83_09G047700 [Erythranthe nasuta]
MEESVGETLMIEDLGDDIILEILSLLPAKSFASAALVCRKWNVICNCILSSPKLSSAVSLNPSLEEAVNEVVDKVLSEPIRPHFALASIGPSFVLQEALLLIERKLCSKIPIIVSVAEGVIGKDVLTDKFVEVQWTEHTVTCGIILTVGFLPGVTVHLCLIFQYQVPEGIEMDFQAASFDSHVSSPVGLILFAGRKADVRRTVQGIELVFPEDGFIVGDGGSSNFIVRYQNTTTLPGLAGVSLLFTRDINKPSGKSSFPIGLMRKKSIQMEFNIFFFIFLKYRWSLIYKINIFFIFTYLFAYRCWRN